MSEERFDRIEQRLDRLETGQHELQSGLTGLRSDMTGLRSGLTELDHHMHILHEDVIARIAATREYAGPTRAEFAELKEMFGRRIEPLETTVRHHSVEIDRLKQRRS